jgi:hypothetical protein
MVVRLSLQQSKLCKRRRPEKGNYAVRSTSGKIASNSGRLGNFRYCSGDPQRSILNFCGGAVGIIQAATMYSKMKRSFLVGFAATSFCLALSVALPISALARVSSEIPDLPAAPAYSESETAAILQEIKVFAHVPVSIREAITIAEKSTPGIPGR